MRFALALAATALMLAALPARAETVTLCTLIADAETGAPIREEGDCTTRVTPASTFKIAISVMGYDAGFLRDEHTPAMPFKQGYPDWRPVWRQTTDPAGWMRESVVWYSQQVTQALGEDRFAAYLAAFGYGNADGSGDPGKGNGLERAWLSSSLTISAREQVAFLRKLATGTLAASPHAHAMTVRLIDLGAQKSGWHVFGKTGSGMPRNRDGSLARNRAYGWFVGWAVKEGRRVVFAKLRQDKTREEAPSGPRARDALLRDLAALPGF